ncbi:type I-U CRISPR-associated protein Cas5/Cas6 [bacterium CPR1]|nr:type I-U CRISPR-associated protein Cas5/Cas6 [bacterium CPR1]
MLAIGIRYLNGFAAAAEPGDYDRVEWPPHPGRVFMALAAAHFHSEGGPEERAALLWLERLGPPAVHAPGATPRAVVLHYVPVNDRAGPSKALLHSLPLTRDRQPRSFARAWLDQDTAFMLWEAEPEGPVRSALETLCSKVSRLGHSMSLVQMWLAQPEDASAPNWIPDDGRATLRMRLATEGTLGELERRYNAGAVEHYASLKVAEADDSDSRLQKEARKRLKEEFADGPPMRLRPNLPFYQGYAPPAPPAPPAGRGTTFAPQMLVFRLEAEAAPYRHLDLQSVLAITQRWREALCSQSNDSSSSVRSLLSGHDPAGAPLEQAHLAFVPLGFVGNDHADGRLLGMGCALPRELPVEDRRGLLESLARVPVLKLGRLGVWKLRAETTSSPPYALRSDTWTAHPRGARIWGSVTPVVYDRHPKGRTKKEYLEEVAGMIRQACARTGLPAPAEVVVLPVSTHLGVPTAGAFPRLQRKDGSLRRQTHALLIFDDRICGPLLLGAGRYRGYGFFRPLNEMGGD